MTIENKDKTALFLMLAATFAHVASGPVSHDPISQALSVINASVWIMGALLWLPDLLVLRQGVAQHSEPPQQEAESDTSADNFVILHASYGGRAKESRIDVTELLQAMIVNSSLNVRAANDVVGRDPAPGIVKTLEITYLLNENERTEVIPESWVLRIGEIEGMDETEEIDLIQAVLDSTDEHEDWKYEYEPALTETKTSSGSVM